MQFKTFLFDRPFVVSKTEKSHRTYFKRFVRPFSWSSFLTGPKVLCLGLWYGVKALFYLILASISTPLLCLAFLGGLPFLMLWGGFFIAGSFFPLGALDRGAEVCKTVVYAVIPRAVYIFEMSCFYAFQHGITALWLVCTLPFYAVGKLLSHVLFWSGNDWFRETVLGRLLHRRSDYSKEIIGQPAVNKIEQLCKKFKEATGQFYFQAPAEEIHRILERYAPSEAKKIDSAEYAFQPFHLLGFLEWLSELHGTLMLELEEENKDAFPYEREFNLENDDSFIRVALMHYYKTLTFNVWLTESFSSDRHVRYAIHDVGFSISRHHLGKKRGLDARRVVTHWLLKPLCSEESNGECRYPPGYIYDQTLSGLFEAFRWTDLGLSLNLAISLKKLFEDHTLQNICHAKDIMHYLLLSLVHFSHRDTHAAEYFSKNGKQILRKITNCMAMDGATGLFLENSGGYTELYRKYLILFRFCPFDFFSTMVERGIQSTNLISKSKLLENWIQKLYSLYREDPMGGHMLQASNSMRDTFFCMVSTILVFDPKFSVWRLARLANTSPLLHLFRNPRFGVDKRFDEEKKQRTISLFLRSISGIDNVMEAKILLRLLALLCLLQRASLNETGEERVYRTISGDCWQALDSVFATAEGENHSLEELLSYLPQWIIDLLREEKFDDRLFEEPPLLQFGSCMFNFEALTVTDFNEYFQAVQVAHRDELKSRSKPKSAANNFSFYQQHTSQPTSSNVPKGIGSRGDCPTRVLPLDGLKDLPSEEVKASPSSGFKLS